MTNQVSSSTASHEKIVETSLSKEAEVIITISATKEKKDKHEKKAQSAKTLTRLFKSVNEYRPYAKRIFFGVTMAVATGIALHKIYRSIYPCGRFNPSDAFNLYGCCPESGSWSRATWDAHDEYCERANQRLDECRNSIKSLLPECVAAVDETGRDIIFYDHSKSKECTNNPRGYRCKGKLISKCSYMWEVGLCKKVAQRIVDCERVGLASLQGKLLPGCIEVMDKMNNNTIREYHHSQSEECTLQPNAIECKSKGKTICSQSYLPAETKMPGAF